MAGRIPNPRPKDKVTFRFFRDEFEKSDIAETAFAKRFSDAGSYISALVRKDIDEFKKRKNI